MRSRDPLYISLKKEMDISIIMILVYEGQLIVTSFENVCLNILYILQNCNGPIYFFLELRGSSLVDDLLVLI